MCKKEQEEKWEIKETEGKLNDDKEEKGGETKSTIKEKKGEGWGT